MESKKQSKVEMGVKWDYPTSANALAQKRVPIDQKIPQQDVRPSSVIRFQIRKLTHRSGFVGQECRNANQRESLLGNRINVSYPPIQRKPYPMTFLSIPLSSYPERIEDTTFANANKGLLVHRAYTKGPSRDWGEVETGFSSFACDGERRENR